MGGSRQSEQAAQSLSAREFSGTKTNIFVLSLVFACCLGCHNSFPWQNPSLPPEKRVEDYLRRLAPGAKPVTPRTFAVPSEFPPDIAMAATWDTDLVGSEARAIAHEALAHGKDQVLGPDLPGYGDDPWLASRMGVAYVSAMQAEGIIATVKTFPTGADGHIDERTLNERLWPPFRAAIEQAGVWSAIADNPDAPAVTDVLKNDWGFKGFVVSGHPPAGGDKVRRTLAALFATGAFDREHRADGAIDPAERGAVLQAAANESTILLKNAGGILPLDARKVHSLAVIGRHGFEGIRERAGAMIEVKFDPGDNPIAAAGLARKSDVAIVCAARDSEDRLIQAIAAVNPRTIVVLTAGPVDGGDKWIDRVAALVTAWLPEAIPAVLFGDVTPSGKLPQTGFGLSYTTFTYSDLRIFPATPQYGQTVQVVFQVRNTGTRPGAEVAQVYIGHPERRLKGFQRVVLKPGETATVPVALDRRSIWFYDSAVHDWANVPGVYDVLIGSSSTDIRLKGRFELVQ